MKEIKKERRGIRKEEIKGGMNNERKDKRQLRTKDQKEEIKRHEDKTQQRTGETTGGDKTAAAKSGDSACSPRRYKVPRPAYI